jgi:hypothetical protein
MPSDFRRFRAHVKGHEAVTTNEYWYGGGPPLLKSTFSAAKTAERQAKVIDLLERAANKAKTHGDRQQSRQLGKLANKLDCCRRRDRCGSQACPECARAFQRAKAAAQQELIKQITKSGERRTAPRSQPRANRSQQSGSWLWRL